MNSKPLNYLLLFSAIVFAIVTIISLILAWSTFVKFAPIIVFILIFLTIFLGILTTIQMFIRIYRNIGGIKPKSSIKVTAKIDGTRVSIEAQDIEEARKLSEQFQKLDPKIERIQRHSN